ncbi:hypothetical protein B0H14DRAFT_3146015 [Mycena olivaceomarginata]|nr:hypothetical protein B0H14DRAFT_3146015 [Mycena olivaceomarginata]
MSRQQLLAKFFCIPTSCLLPPSHCPLPVVFLPLRPILSLDTCILSCSRKRVQKCLANVRHSIQTTSAYTINVACIPRLGPLRMTNIIALRIQDKTGTELDNIPVLRYCVSCLPPTNWINRLLHSWMALVGHVVEQVWRGGVGDVVYGH